MAQACSWPPCTAPWQILGKPDRRRCGTWFRLRWRTYDAYAAWLTGPVVLRPVRPATSTRSPELVATLTQTFLCTDIEGSTAMMQRLTSCAIGCRSAWG